MGEEDGAIIAGIIQRPLKIMPLLLINENNGLVLQIHYIALIVSTFRLLANNRSLPRPPAAGRAAIQPSIKDNSFGQWGAGGTAPPWSIHGPFRD